MRFAPSGTNMPASPNSAMPERDIGTTMKYALPPAAKLNSRRCAADTRRTSVLDTTAHPSMHQNHPEPSLTTAHSWHTQSELVTFAAHPLLIWITRPIVSRKSGSLILTPLFPVNLPRGARPLHAANGSVSLMRDLGVTEGDISATTGHSIAVMRAVYPHPLPKERRGGTDAIAAALLIPSTR